MPHLMTLALSAVLAGGTGAKSIGPLLVAGTDVLVTWVPYWGTDGKGAVDSSYRRALEIRELAHPNP